MNLFPGITQTKFKKPATRTAVLPKASAASKKSTQSTTVAPHSTTRKSKSSHGHASVTKPRLSPARAPSIEYADDPTVSLPGKNPSATSSRTSHKRRVPADEDSPEPERRMPVPDKKARSSSPPRFTSESPPPETRSRSPSPVQVDGMSLEAWLGMIHLLDGKSNKAMRIENDYESVYQTCRSMIRKMGHFVRFERVIRTGLLYLKTSFADQPWAKSSTYDTAMEDRTMWDVLIADFPGFETHITHLHGDHEGVRILSRFLTAIVSKTRSDDILRMEYNTNFLRACKIPNSKYKLSEKQYRGYKNTTMARRLIPPKWIAKFDLDPHAMTQKLKDGDITPLPADLPSCLWDLAQYNPNDTIAGFLYSDDVRIAYKLLYTGPDSAIENYNKTGKGQPSLARKYGLTTVTIHSIVYVALLVRHAWSTQPAWKDTDGFFSYPTMARLILSVCMRNPTYISKLVADYTNDIYGTTGQYGDVNPEDDPESTFGMLMQGPNELEDIPGAYFQYALSRRVDHGGQAGPEPDSPAVNEEREVTPFDQPDALADATDDHPDISDDVREAATE